MTARLLDIGVEAGILAILLLSPIPFGSVFPWAQAGIEALVVLTAATWVVRMLVAGQVALRVNPILWPGIAMLALVGIQLALPAGTVNRYYTWESFRLLAAYFAFLLVLGGHLVTPGRIARLVSVLVAWGAALASWGLVNRALGRELVLGFEKEWYRGRLVSTFVNANHQALYFAVLLFLALGMLLRPSRSSRGGRGTPGMALSGTGPVSRILFGGAAVVLGVALVLTASRGGVASAAAGVLVLAALAVLGRARSQLLVGLAAGLALFAGYLAWVGSGHLLERLAVFAREPFADLRWAIWAATVRIASGAPLVGVGLGGFEDALIGHRPTGLLDGYFVDYAHNEYLQLLAEGGLVGILILAGAAGMWLTFVVGRWRDRQDPFVRGLVMGGLGAVAAVALHSVVDFGLRIPANALLLVVVLALLPAVVTLRAHRAGPQVDLAEWRRGLGFRSRLVAGAVTVVFVATAGVTLASSAIADWKYQTASRLASDKKRVRGALTTADLAGAERELRVAARLDPWNPRIQTEWADVAAELGHRVWSFGVAPDGTRLRPGTARERLAVSQPFLGVAYVAYERSIRSRPLISATRGAFGSFLSRLDAVRRTVGVEHLQDAVAPELARPLGSDDSLLPLALEQLQEAVRLDPASSTRRLGLAAFALAHRAEIPESRTIVIQESREAIRLDRVALWSVVGLLTAGTVEPDLLWHAVPREVATLTELASILERRGQTATAAVALEDAVALAVTPAEKIPLLLARARLLLRRGDKALALSQAQQALTLAPRDADVLAGLAEAYEANGLLAEAEATLGSALTIARDGDPGKLKKYRNRLASLLARRGDPAGVLALRRQAVQAAPNDPEIRLQLAKLLEARREIADALREYETVRGLAPDDPDVQQAVAAAFLRNGLLREATMAAEHAVRLSPEDDDLRVELGDLYVRMGMSDQAREQYRRVLARQPAHEAASRGLRTVGALQNPG